MVVVVVVVERKTDLGCSSSGGDGCGGLKGSGSCCVCGDGGRVRRRGSCGDKVDCSSTAALWFEWCALWWCVMLVEDAVLK